MGTSALSLFNKALRYLGERKLASLNENRESFRYLQDEYSDNNLFCISQGNWNYAMREAEFQAEDAISPNFGYAYVFQKPVDWNHTFQVSDNEAFDPLLRDYTDQNNFWYSNIATIYVKYISIDPNYGLNLGLWTPAFVEYVACRLAWTYVPRLQDKDKIKMINDALKRAKAEALSTDSQDLPPGKPSWNTWVLSRAPRGSVVPWGSPVPGSGDD